MKFKVTKKVRSIRISKVRYFSGDVVDLPETYIGVRGLECLEPLVLPVIPEPKIYAAPQLPKRHRKIAVKVLVGVPCSQDDRYRSYVPTVVEAAEKSLKGVSHEVYVTPNVAGERWPSVMKCYDMIFDKFLAGDYDLLWMVEADNPPPIDAFRKLHSLDVDIAQGVYPLHKDFDKIIMGFLSGHEKRRIRYSCPMTRDKVIGNILDGWLCAGTGCMLLKRQVVESGLRIKYEPKLHMGPDVVYLWEAQMRGFKALAHGGVECGHLPEFPLKEPEVEPVEKTEAEENEECLTVNPAM